MLLVCCGFGIALPTGRALAMGPTGNWEGVSAGHHMSFDVRAGKGGRLAVRQFVLQPPASCAQGAVLAYRRLATIDRHGSFAAAGMSAHLGSARGVVHIHATYTTASGTCRARASIAVRRTTRAPIKDGSWHGATELGEALSLRVTYGGRLATVTDTVSATSCGGAIQLQTTQTARSFVPASGRLIGPQGYSFAFDTPTHAAATYQLSGDCPRSIHGELTWRGG